MPRFRLTLFVSLAVYLSAGMIHADVRLTAAETLLLRGNYEEAAEAFAQLRSQAPVEAALGLARASFACGKLDDAAGVLQEAIAARGDAPDLFAELAEINLYRGEHVDAAAQVARALELNGDHLHGRWLNAELLRFGDKLDEAARAYQWFAEEYDRRGRDVQSPRELHWLGLGLAQHARWNRDRTRFPQLVNELYPQALKFDPDFWPAHYEIGCLLAEKFNEVDATEAFAAALRINPRAADVHAAVAQLAVAEFRLDEARQHIGRAIAANPNCLDAHWANADVNFAALRPDRAERALHEALKINPTHAQTYGRLAVAQQLQSGEVAAATGPRDANHRSGDYHAAAATAFELSRRYPAAAQELAAAIERLPQLNAARGQLGLIQMRLGDEESARALLDESFAIDPYNIRVKNQLEVIDLLDDYAVIETDHFIIRYDPEHDARLARCLSHYAEACHEEFAARFNYGLPQRAVLEIFNDGRGHAGAEWFGVRMVGLPNIHTIAACGGNIVAMVSPPRERGALNWADVVRHELVHLFNIQQTNYAVPHWFTEGCAVWLEGRPRRDEWNRLLAERGPKGELFNLDGINQAFIRPRTSDDWQLAYCQAELYLEVMLSEYGGDAPRNMLAAYAENRSTAEAIEQAFGVSQKEFEKSYQEYLADVLAQVASQRRYRTETNIDKLESRHAAAPDDPQAAAELASARLRRGDDAEAGRLAAKALAADPDHPLARLVRAKLLTRIGDEQAAIDLLKPLAEAESPLPEAVELLAGLLLRRNELSEADRWYRRGAELEPQELSWTKASAAIAVKRGDNAAAEPLLAEIAAAEPSNLIARRKLLQLAVRGDDAKQIARWAEEVLHVNPDDGAAHRELARALLRLKQPQRAADHFEMAAELLPDGEELNRAATDARGEK